MALTTPISITYPRIGTQGSKVVRIFISASACQRSQGLSAAAALGRAVSTE